ncbi:MAG TPA: hypothetical protein VNN79_19995 [Actinomycetota bacterium]|nr:hypothetical protein [Actinomycetota bacterium]
MTAWLETGDSRSWPAHLHFNVTADGCRPLTTMPSFEGGDHLHSDTIDVVKDSLVTSLETVDEPAQLETRGVDSAFSACRFDIRLAPG